MQKSQIFTAACAVRIEAGDLKELPHKLPNLFVIAEIAAWAFMSSPIGVEPKLGDET